MGEKEEDFMMNNVNAIRKEENENIYKMVQIVSPFNFMGNKCHIDEDMVTIDISDRWGNYKLDVNFSEAK